MTIENEDDLAGLKAVGSVVARGAVVTQPNRAR